MNTIFELEVYADRFCPGDSVSGCVRWQLESAPTDLVVSLIWKTDGRGTQDSKQETFLDLHPHARSGQADFTLTLPASPYSFSGKLIQVFWFVEARSKVVKHKRHMPIVVGPDKKQIRL